MKINLTNFVKESNKIEGIIREPTDNEVKALEWFVNLEEPSIYDLQELVSLNNRESGLFEPQLRDNISVPGVRVGGHIAPASGPEIREQLQFILDSAHANWVDRMTSGGTGEGPSPWQTHVNYETLHPFTDGNGRSGRALWLWCMGGYAPLGFLHTFYYQTLSETRL